MPGDSFCYLPADPADLEVFDTAISAIWSDRLGGRITDAQAVKHEDIVRIRREEFIMRRGG